MHSGPEARWRWEANDLSADAFMLSGGRDVPAGCLSSVGLGIPAGVTAEECELLAPLAPLKWAGGGLLSWDDEARCARRWSAVDMRWAADASLGRREQFDGLPPASAEQLRSGTGYPGLLAVLLLGPLREELSPDERAVLAPFAPLRITGDHFLLSWNAVAGSAMRWSGVSQTWRRDPATRAFFDHCRCAARPELVERTGDPGVVPTLLRRAERRARAYDRASREERRAMLRDRGAPGNPIPPFLPGRGDRGGLFACCQPASAQAAALAIADLQSAEEEVQHPPAPGPCPQGICPRGHLLTAFETPEDGWTCSVCARAFAAGSLLHQCSSALCNFDSCDACAQRMLQTRGRPVSGAPAPERAEPEESRPSWPSTVPDLPAVPDELPDDVPLEGAGRACARARAPPWPEDEWLQFDPLSMDELTAPTETKHSPDLGPTDEFDDMAYDMASLDELGPSAEPQKSGLASWFQIWPPRLFT